MAGIFHIFGLGIDSTSHMAGNVAIGNLNAGDFGTNKEALTNLTIGDIHYIDSIVNLNQINGENHKLIIFGPDIKYRAKENEPHRIEVLVDGEWKTFNVPYGHVLQTDQRLDINAKLEELGKKADKWAEHEQTAGVEVKDNIIDLSQVDLSQNEPIYVTVNADYITGNNKHEFRIKGIPAGALEPIIILNVISKNTGLTLNTHMVLEYRDGSTITNSGEKHEKYNKLLWNFGTKIEEIIFDNDYFFGSVLAPNAHLIVKQNVDGNIIGKKLTLTGETHRWDLIPPLEEVEKPDQPTSPSQPTTPTQPTSPTQPTTPSTPNSEEFTPPLPEEEPGSEYPSQPEKDEEEFVAPHAEKEDSTTPEVAPVKAATVSDEKQTPETVSTEMTEVIEKGQSEETLPETGEHNKSEVAGLLGALAAALGITSLAGTSKKRKKKDE
ncbi:collagen-binding domain-containing protein [Lactobacillus ultunensis]|nr:collagen-binding domain-containing protein [Lactobacillus ultunensis]